MGISSSNKLTYDYVKQYIESNSGCKLVTQSYTNNAQKLDLVCACGNEFKATFANIHSFKKTKCNECGKKQYFNSKRRKDIDKYFNDGRIIPCEFCSSKDKCNSCKIYSYFKRNKIYKEELNGWNIKDVITVLDYVLYEKVEVLNEVVDIVQNKTLLDVVELLDTKIKIGGNKPQNIKLKCANCNKDIIRKKSDMYKDRVYCNMECRDKIRSIMFTPPNKLSLDDVKDLCNKNDGILLSDTYISNRYTIGVMDLNGYKYETTMQTLQRGSLGKKFKSDSKYIMHNIKKYIELNHLNVDVIDEVYVNNSTKMRFRCGCGEMFETTWANFTNGKTTCNECSNITKWNLDTVREYVKEKTGCDVVSDEYINNETKFSVRCHCGDIFETVLHQIQRGRNECPKCAKKHIVNPRKKTYDEAYEIFSQSGLELLDKEYRGYNIRHKCVNKDGYYIYTNLYSILSGRGYSVFGNGNPCTTENVVRWLTINEPSYSLLSDSVENCRDKLRFKCDKGHIYKVHWTNFLMGRRCPKCRNERISKALSNDINTFKQYVLEVTNGEYECISDEYINAGTKVRFVHKECGREFEATPGKFTGSKNRNGSRCPICQSELIESVHATVLKQLFKKYKKDVVLEDPSCINPLTGFILPTDIVCYDEKIVVEVQSWFHDRDYQKVKDDVKRKFWESKGFIVYTPDVRKYSSLSMAQIFFKDMKEIPKWVDYKYGRDQIDIRIVQDMLDDYRSTKEIGEALGVKRHTIQRLIDSGEVTLKDNHYNVLKNIRKVCMINLENELVAIYNNATEAANLMGKSQTQISKAMKNTKNCNYYDGYIWVSEDDFEKCNYNIDKSKINTGKRPIVKLSLEMEYIKEYPSIVQATKLCDVSRDVIHKNLNGKYKSVKGFVWMYKEDYEKHLKQQKISKFF